MEAEAVQTSRKPTPVARAAIRPDGSSLANRRGRPPKILNQS